jgi:hypothetical protein
MFRLNLQRFTIAACLAALVFFGLTREVPVQAAPVSQYTPFPTPTPGSDGRIIYIAQAGDSWWRIAAIFNINLDQLLSLNNATRETVINPGDPILLGIGGPAELPTATFGPSPTVSPLTPTPSPLPGAGTLCVLLFNDSNGDSIRQTAELSIPGGALSVADRTGKVSFTETTITGADPYCFKDLPEGEYNISVAVPDGYNPTTVMNYTLAIEPGSETYLDFGAQQNSKTIAEAPTPTGSGNSLLLGGLGVVLILGGIVLGIITGGWLKRNKRKPESQE